MIVVLMGVCGCGKTTVGELLAPMLGAPFFDGDGFHPPANVEKMRSGVPLTDADRRPWLERLNAEMKGWNRGHAHEIGAVLACSALRKSYREMLGKGLADQAVFVLLHGPKALLEERMQARRGHYMPPGLLESQLATLELPGADEDALTVGIDAPPAALARQIAGVLSMRLKRKT
ncbi:MAG: gluconokinase [Planctomycetes bacterium]|nr:gluconokinase [Planctomycetota bacterium]